MRKRSLLGLALIVAGAAVLSGVRAGRRACRTIEQRGDVAWDWTDDDAVTDRDVAGATVEEIERAPLVVIRGAFDRVNVAAADRDSIAVETAGGGESVRVARADDGSKVTLMLPPRRNVEVNVPRGTAIQLQLAKSRERSTASTKSSSIARSRASRSATSRARCAFAAQNRMST